MRGYGTTRSGLLFSDAMVQAVWNKGAVVPGYSPNEWRRDQCGAPISRQQYGNTNSKHGWEIDHVLPVSKGGSDDLANLQPLQWENNRSKADHFPEYLCKVS